MKRCRIRELRRELYEPSSKALSRYYDTLNAYQICMAGAANYIIAIIPAERSKSLSIRLKRLL